MKRIIVSFVISFLFPLLLNSRTIEIKIKNVDWYCWGHGTYTCTIIIDDGKKKGGHPITRTEAEAILGQNLPSNAIPCIFVDTNNQTQPTQILPQQRYIGINDPNFKIIEGEWQDLPYTFPEQTVVYSHDWGGYVGYYVNE
ncbi:MAG: hypothetical protein QXY47_06125 [Thermoplasmata archaeon]